MRLSNFDFRVRLTCYHRTQNILYLQQPAVLSVYLSRFGNKFDGDGVRK